MSPARMVFALAVIAVPNCFSATPPVLSEVGVTDITRSSARITWRTDISATGKIEWGPTSSLGFKIDDGGKFTAHTFFMSTLLSDTPYSVRACSSDSKESCSEIYSFRTLPPVPFPVAPKVAAQVNTSLPAVNGKTLTVREDCADFQQQINIAAAQNGDLTHAVVIPASAVCVGDFTLPVRTGPNPKGDGWILIEGSNVDIPPQDARIDMTFQSQIPRLIGNKVTAIMYPLEPKGFFCAVGDFWWDDDEKVFSLHRCTDPDGPKWETIAPVGSGTQVPKTCNDGDWFYKTDIPQHNKRSFWCVEPNVWRNVEFVGGGFENSAIFHPAPQARRYRIIGLTMQALKSPASYIESFSADPKSNHSPAGSAYGCLGHTRSDNDSILFDRVIFDGIGYPNRTVYALCFFDGSNVGVINSTFNEINRWVNPATWETSQNAIFFNEGPGPVLIENNFFKNVHGITIFHSDDHGSAAKSSANDVTIRRNVFWEDPADNALDPRSNGRFYWRRNFIEPKRGERWLIEGNLFLGGWPANTSGSCLSFTPRPGNEANLQSKLAIRDVIIRDNLFRYCPEGVSILGQNDNRVSSLEQSARFLIENNVSFYFGMSPTGFFTGWPYKKPENGQFVSILNGVQDVSVRSNTIYESVANAFNANFITILLDPSNTGLEVRDNIFTVTGPNKARSGIWLGGQAEGKAALDLSFKQGNLPQWRMSNNLFAGRDPAPGAYPPETYFESDAAKVGLNGDLSLSSTSPYRAGSKASAASGGDLGADITRMRKVMGWIDEAVVQSAGAHAATLTYNFWNLNDNAYCAVDVATDADFTDARRFWDNGSGRARTVNLTELVSGTSQFVRILCPGQSQQGVFRTTAEAAPAGDGSQASNGVAAKSMPLMASAAIGVKPGWLLIVPRRKDSKQKR